MNGLERETFNVAVEKLMGLFNRRLDDEQKKIWWVVLKRQAFDDVRAAFLRWSGEKTHAPTPANIRELCRESSPAKQNNHAEVRVWTRSDLLVACNMKACFPADWLQKVTRSYDSALAETCENITEKFPHLAPAEAAREHFKEHPGWMQPVSAYVPM